MKGETKQHGISNAADVIAVNISFEKVNMDIGNAPIDPISPIFELESIDQEIESLSDRLLFLKTKRNSLVPIARLHPNLLVEIFLTVQGLYLREPRFYHQWINLAQVSRHWRNIALENILLWSTIVQARHERHYELAEMSFKRSGSADLSILFHELNTSRKHFDLFLDLLSHPKRIRSLNIRLHSDFNGQASGLSEVITRLEQPMPCLRELTLAGMPHSGIDYTSGVQSLFAPGLRSLVLTHAQIGLPEDLSSLSELSHLELTDIHPGASFTVSPILHLLEHTRKLTTLKLNWRLPSMGDPDLPGFDGLIYLPLLSSIHLETGLDECITILNSIRFPSKAAFHFRKSSRLRSRHQINDFFNSLSNALMGGQRDVHQFEYLVHPSNLYLRMVDADSSINPSFFVRLDPPQNTDWVSHLSPSNWVLFSNLRTMRFSNSRRIPLPTFAPSASGLSLRRRSDLNNHFAIFSILASSPLSELILVGSFAEETAEFITQFPTAFPALETIKVHEAVLRPEMLSRLSSALEIRRHHHGRMLASLILNTNRIEDKVAMDACLRSLREVVSDVVMISVNSSGPLPF